MKHAFKQIATLVLCVSLAAAPPALGASPGKKVTFKSGSNSLVGFLYQPEGAGPWPALIWNHGSEKDPGAGPQFATVAAAFVPAGYVVFAPERRGHGGSQGVYIVDRLKMTMQMQGKEEGDRLAARLLATEQLDDQLAGPATGLPSASRPRR